jgi:peptidoglycan/LPS O-acetylase OafA/YrhL
MAQRVPQQPAHRKFYSAELDGLRGCAIFMVLLEHCGGLLAAPFDFGYYGVELFLVLSGFLITRILLNSVGSTRAELWNFFWRRSLRIFPLYYLCLLLFLLFNFGNARDHMLWLATYTWNYWCAFNRPETNPLFYLWSLSVEEQFYLVWPLFALLTRRNRFLFLWTCVLLILFSYGQIMYGFIPTLRPMTYTGLPCRIGALCLGGAAAGIRWKGTIAERFLASRSLELLGICGVAWAMATLRTPTLAGGLWAYRLVFPIMSLASALFVLKCAENKNSFTAVRLLFGSRSMQLLGAVSYCVYLIHVPMNHLVSTVFDPVWVGLHLPNSGPLRFLRYNSWLIKFPIVFLLSFLTSLLSSRFLETPVRRFRDRHFAAITRGAE